MNIIKMVSRISEALTLAFVSLGDRQLQRLSRNVFIVADGQTMNLELVSLNPNKKVITVDPMNELTAFATLV